MEIIILTQTSVVHMDQDVRVIVNRHKVRIWKEIVTNTEEYMKNKSYLKFKVPAFRRSVLSHLRETAPCSAIPIPIYRTELTPIQKWQGCTNTGGDYNGACCFQHNYCRVSLACKKTVATHTRHEERAKKEGGSLVTTKLRALSLELASWHHFGV